MTDVERDEDAPLFPRKAGELLRAAREEKGMALADVAQKTRVPMRHLEAIEQSRYELLPAPTYATGFAKAYARAVGADEVDIARRVRVEAAEVVRPAKPYTPYVTADPKRLPSRLLALTAAAVGVAILIAAMLWLAASRLTGRNDEAAPPAPVASASTPVPASAPAPAGKVRLEATGDTYVTIHDANHDPEKAKLFDRLMKSGDSFDVPSGADHPVASIGRPDKLRITLNGSVLAALGNGDRPLTNFAIDPASLAARAAGSPTPTPSASPSPAATRTSEPRPRPSPSATRTRRETNDDDTARANAGPTAAVPSAAPTTSPPPAPADSPTTTP